MDNKKLAQTLFDSCGGASNIVEAENCMTRLRVVLNDRSKADIEKIKKTDDVIGFVGESNDIQIVLGPGKVTKVTNLFKELLDNSDTSQPQKTNFNGKRTKLTVVQDGLKKLSQIFVPLIPGIMAAGLMLGITSVVNVCIQQYIIPENSIVKAVVILLTILANGCLSFLPIFVGVNASKVFKCSPILGGMMGGLVLLEGVGEFSKALDSIGAEFFNWDAIFYNVDNIASSLLITGKGGVIGVVLGVWLLSKIERFLHKRMPDSLDIIVVPFCTVLISGIVMLFVFMPIAGFLCTGIIDAFQFLSFSSLAIVRIIYGFVLGATFLPMVCLGLHQSLVPIYMLQLDQTGSISMLAAQMMAGGANIGAAIAIYFKAKSVGHKSLQTIIKGSLPTAVLGIHEPLIYGMTLPIAISFAPIGIGAGVGGAFCTMTNVLASSYGPATLLGVTTMQPSSMVNYLIGLVISCVVACLFTNIIVRKKRVKIHMDGLKEGINNEFAPEMEI